MALVAESFADAGVAHGLAADDAVRMTVETMAGTAAYLRAHDYDTEALRTRVATPGGTTERGLIRLEERGLRERLPRRGGRGGGGDRGDERCGWRSPAATWPTTSRRSRSSTSS